MVVSKLRSLRFWFELQIPCDECGGFSLGEVDWDDESLVISFSQEYFSRVRRIHRE